jgi:hypothetical protein
MSVTIPYAPLSRTRHQAEVSLSAYSQRPTTAIVRIIHTLLNFPKTTTAVRSKGAIVHNYRAIVHQLFIIFIFT